MLAKRKDPYEDTSATAETLPTLKEIEDDRETEKDIQTERRREQKR